MAPQRLNRFALFGATEAIAWERVYAEELPRIYNFFRYRVGDERSAEDLTATTFEKAWRARGRYQHDRSAFSTWLYTIACNVAADHFRHNHSELSLDDIRQQPAQHWPGDQIERQEEFARLSALLAHLSDRERELLALKYGADLNNRVIARLTGLSESNVGTILHRVITQLRAQWDAEP